MHKPISLKNICLSFNNKTCIDEFSMQIHCGARIAIIGRNGCGKSSLLRLLQGTMTASSGELQVPSDVQFGYVPQTIKKFVTLSGGQRLNRSLTEALRGNPNVLLLDEPTNHLDSNNRSSLMRYLNSYCGTLIIVTHDTEILRNCIDTLWHMDNGRVVEFSGNYDDYMREKGKEQQLLEKQLVLLKREKKDMHTRLMKEQARAKNSKSKGEKSIRQKKWPTVVSAAKATRAEQTSGKNRLAIDKHKNLLTEKISSLSIPEIIIPNFALLSADIKSGVLVSVSNGAVGYSSQEPVLQEIYFSLSSQERIAIVGNNGCGKSTVMKAILNDPAVITTGCWSRPAVKDIGYLDQHYVNVEPNSTVLESLCDWVPAWSITELRRHLNDFLFRTNEAVNTLGRNLSGGEKARFSLAMIAARPPKLLILDEITNNLDMETKDHVTQILCDYPAAMIIVSHDEGFLKKIKINRSIEIANGSIVEKN